MCDNKDFNNYYVNDLYIPIITMTLFIYLWSQLLFHKKSFYIILPTYVNDKTCIIVF